MCIAVLQVFHSTPHMPAVRHMITYRASESRFESFDYDEQLASTADSKIQIGPSLSNRIESKRPIRIRNEPRSFAGPYLFHNLQSTFLAANAMNSSVTGSAHCWVSTEVQSSHI